MDNVSFHKTKLVKTLIGKSSNKLLYIPPYSPQFNPIEEVFSQIKRNINYIKNGNIIQKFNKSTSFVTTRNFKNYYKHSFSVKNT
jgi:transposase